MKRLNLRNKLKLGRVLNPDKLVPVLRWVGWPAIIAYIASMVVVPIARGGSDWWTYVQDVWDRWQGFNIGMLALIASVIAFEATRYSEDKQRERDFLAARSFLPDALSELSTYLADCASMYSARWSNAAFSHCPSVPRHNSAVFADCIRQADPEAGKQLSELLSWLQVHDSRLTRFFHNQPHGMELLQLEAINGLRLVGELQARTNRLFDFARGEGHLDSRPIEWGDYYEAFRNLKLHPERFVLGDTESLENATRRVIDNGKRNAPKRSEAAQ